MANPYKDEAGHYTNKENDGGPCRHKRINGGQYEYSDDEGKSWKAYSSREDYDKDEAEYDKFDENVEDDFGFDEENPEDEDKSQYVVKIRDDIESASDKKAFEYIADNIDELTEAGLISEEMSDTLYNELDKKIDESGERMPLFNTKIEKEPNPMDEFSGPDREGPSYAQLDKMKNYNDRINKSQERYIEKTQDLPFGELLNRERHEKAEEIAKNNGWYAPNHFAYINGVRAYEEGEFDDNDLINYFTEQYGKTKNDNKSEDNFNKGLTVDAPEKGEGWKKTKMASGILYEGPNGQRVMEDSETSEESNNLEWRLKPEYMTVVQDLQKMGVDTAKLTEEDMKVAKDFLGRFKLKGK